MLTIPIHLIFLLGKQKNGDQWHLTIEKNNQDYKITGSPEDIQVVLKLSFSLLVQLTKSPNSAFEKTFEKNTSITNAQDQMLQ